MVDLIEAGFLLSFQGSNHMKCSKICEISTKRHPLCTHRFGCSLFKMGKLKTSIKNAFTSRKTLICKCRSHCSSYDADTGLYNGGQLVSRGTRDNHRKDDEMLAAREGSPPSNAPRSPLRNHERLLSHQSKEMNSTSKWIALINEEVSWHLESSVTTPSLPLAFVNDPASHGEFTWPSSAELLRPNYGNFSLIPGRHANEPFLARENRFCELVTFAHTMEQSDELSALLDRLYDGLTRLQYEKELQWTGQRAHLEPGKVLENTGKITYTLS